MRQRDRLDQIIIQLQRPRHRPGDLRDLDGMRHARPEIVTLVIDENLRLVFQLAKGGGMQDTVAVALKRCPGNKLACLLAIFCFAVKPSARPRAMTGIGRQLAVFGNI